MIKLALVVVGMSAAFFAGGSSALQVSSRPTQAEMKLKHTAAIIKSELSMIRMASEMDIADMVKILRGVLMASKKESDAAEFRRLLGKAVVHLGLGVASCQNDISFLRYGAVIEKSVAKDGFGGKHLKAVLSDFNKHRDHLRKQIERARKELK